MREFIALCRQPGALGLFIHTGKTGPSYKLLIDEQHHIIETTYWLLVRLVNDPPDSFLLLWQSLS